MSTKPGAVAGSCTTATSTRNRALYGRWLGIISEEEMAVGHPPPSAIVVAKGSRATRTGVLPALPRIISLELARRTRTSGKEQWSLSMTSARTAVIFRRQPESQRGGGSVSWIKRPVILPADQSSWDNRVVNRRPVPKPTVVSDAWFRSSTHWYVNESAGSLPGPTRRAVRRRGSGASWRARSPTN